MNTENGLNLKTTWNDDPGESKTFTGIVDSSAVTPVECSVNIRVGYDIDHFFGLRRGKTMKEKQKTFNEISPQYTVKNVTEFKNAVIDGAIIIEQKRMAAATSRAMQIADSRPAPSAEPQSEPPSERDRDLVDSISAIVDRDSILELSAAMVFYKKQLQLKKYQLDTRLECLEFLLANKCRTKAQATAYLVVLKRYCDDRQAMYYAARRTVPDNQKHLAVAYMHKAQADCGRVQVMIERLEK